MKIYYIMGVAGSGKSTIGKMLADKLNIPFFDADDFHPPSNIEKMKSGQPLNDDDRRPWLQNIADTARNQLSVSGAVIACSALKENYRRLLCEGIESHTEWVFLNGSKEIIEERMSLRKDHFMPPALLTSQFQTLETPANAITIDISLSPEEIIAQIVTE
ncbi:MAG: gluconokinase [Bacteroidia bacterium]|nr:gluconokinase [Bacteroidia bacterium]